MSEATATTEEETATETMGSMVLSATRDGEGTALRHPQDGEWVEVSYEELGRRIRQIARGLIALGVEPGDRVAIFANTRVEWTLADLGTTCAAGVVACVYHTSAADEVRHILSNSGSKVVFCDGQDQLDRVQEVREDLPELEHIVLFDGEAEGEGVITFDDLHDRADEVEEEEVDKRVEAVDSDDLYTLIYTSGTTGPPKGCILTHGNYKSNLEMLERVIDPGDDPVMYLFLPLAHTFTRMAQMVGLSQRGELAFWSGDKDKLLDDLKEVRPTHFPAVPRIFEKIYNQAQAKLPGGPAAKLFEKGIEAGRKVQDKQHAGEEPGPLLKAGHSVMDKRVLSEVRDLFGGRLRLALTGAAPVNEDMLEFFYACGVLVLEGYGATETSAVVSANTPENFRFGTVGQPLEGGEVRIAEEDGEILVRGPHVFHGYRGMEEETNEVLDEDGWFHTEDIGSLDDDGFLSIEGRKKDIIVTSSGKNIPAAAIENKLGDSRWISSAVVYGDDKNYLVALLTIDEDERDALAEEAGASSSDPQEMAEDDNVRAELQKAVDEANEHFADIEQVKKFAVLDHDLSEENDELTPTMKVKRSVVYENYRDTFEGLYEEDGEG
jgi:long-chain acyl-CoA synthetase